MGVAIFQKGFCECGQYYMIFSPDKAELVARMAEDLKDSEISIYLAENTEVFCNNCGRVINLPPAEVLDTDKTPFGRWLEGFSNKE